MARTTTSAVQQVLGQNYNGSSSLIPYIDSAYAVVSRLLIAASAQSISIGDTDAELVERWLAAHYYTVMDPLYIEKETGRARGKWKERCYLDVAKQMDPSGLLGGIVAAHKIRVTWLGKPPSEQVDYEDRD